MLGKAARNPSRLALFPDPLAPVRKNIIAALPGFQRIQCLEFGGDFKARRSVRLTTAGDVLYLAVTLGTNCTWPKKTPHLRSPKAGRIVKHAALAVPHVVTDYERLNEL